MKINEKSYIARKFYTHPQGAQSIYEECIFESYDSAYQYILSISEEDCDRFICEIVSLVIGSEDSYKTEERWTFDRKGKLIHHYDANKKRDELTKINRDGNELLVNEPRPSSYSGKFTIGQIVVVRAYPWCQESHMPEDTTGVITKTPISFKEWLDKGNDRYDWDSEYVIDYIRNGYLTHMHIPESHIIEKEGALHAEQFFLKILSNHFKGVNLINNDVLMQIYEGKIFVEKVKQYTDYIEQNI